MQIGVLWIACPNSASTSAMRASNTNSSPSWKSEVNRLLTPRQRAVLPVAIEAGYYAVPRDVTLTDVAKEMDISKSTCSDILHRCESNIVTWFAAEQFNQV